MKVPSFLYIGAPRAGSTWIFEALRAHPEVFVPDAKYVKFFFNEQYWRGWDWYLDHFSAATADHKAIGEITTGYLYKEDALDRINEHIPNARILVTVRNPIERDWSAYLFMKRNGTIDMSFREAMDSNREFISLYSQYDMFLPLVWDRFPKENVEVFVFDDLAANPRAFGKRLYGFVGVDPTFEYNRASKKQYAAMTVRSLAVARFVKHLAVWVRRQGNPNLVGRVKRIPGIKSLIYRPIDKSAEKKLSVDDRTFLLDRYRPHVERLSHQLGRDLSHWLE